MKKFKVTLLHGYKKTKITVPAVNKEAAKYLSSVATGIPESYVTNVREITGNCKPINKK